VRNQAFTELVEKELEVIIRDHCVRITPENWIKQSSPFKQFVQWTAFQTIRVLFFLFTFYFKQEKGKG
ncbi:MAG: hypothetical protein ABUM51_05330, partial [Bacteroidota bacterium]